MFRRLIYLPYYLLNTPAHKFASRFAFVKKNKNISAFRILSDMFFCSLRYNTSFLDYFDLRFYQLNASERSRYIGTGAMYEYQLKMNPRKHRKVLCDKIEFLTKFNDLSGRQWTTLDMIKQNPQSADRFLENSAGRIVLKNSKGQAGKEVKIFFTKEFNYASLVHRMEEQNFDLLETYVVQNERLMHLSSSGVNTLRIITQYQNGQVIILAARLRISVNSAIDNLSTGNIASHIDLETGCIAAPAIYSDLTKSPVTMHPITGVSLIGFEIPFWKECLELVTKAALRIPENRSIGWDVAVTNSGPVLIEGNHNWHHFLLQMPEQKGYKNVIERYAAGL